MTEQRRQPARDLVRERCSPRRSPILQYFGCQPRSRAAGAQHAKSSDRVGPRRSWRRPCPRLSVRRRARRTDRDRPSRSRRRGVAITCRARQSRGRGARRRTAHGGSLGRRAAVRERARCAGWAAHSARWRGGIGVALVAAAVHAPRAERLICFWLARRNTRVKARFLGGLALAPGPDGAGVARVAQFAPRVLRSGQRHIVDDHTPLGHPDLRTRPMVGGWFGVARPLPALHSTRRQGTRRGRGQAPRCCQARGRNPRRHGGHRLREERIHRQRSSDARRVYPGGVDERRRVGIGLNPVVHGGGAPGAGVAGLGFWPRVRSSSSNSAASLGSSFTNSPMILARTPSSIWSR